MFDQVINNNNKRVSTGEIIVTLFELCNLNCLFCSQNHDSIEGIDTVREKVEPTIKAIQVLKTRHKQRFSIHIMGGEVFDDRIEDKIFDDYRYLVYKLLDYCQENNIDVDIGFTTNLIFSKVNRVFELLEDTGTYLMTSYDPAARFNPKTLPVFENNVKLFKKYLKSVNVIMTRPNINKFLSADTPVFDYLYENYPIYFDYYTPEKNYDYMLPNDIELKQLMIFIIDNYPECLPFKNFKDKNARNMSCMDTYTVLPNGKFGICNVLITNLSRNYVPSKEEMEQKWMEDYNCMQCKYLQRCSLGCFLSNHVKNIRTQQACWMQEVYDYVDNKWT